MYNNYVIFGGKMKKFLKKHRYTCILLLIFILIVVLGFKVKDILVPDEGKATYGERLKDIDNHPIDKTIYDKIEEEFAKNTKVLDISHRVQGKIINYILTVNDDMSIKDAKALGDKIVSHFDEETLSYYSLQVYVKKNDASKNNFPIVGYKDPLSKSISWSKDREITKSDENEE